MEYLVCTADFLLGHGLDDSEGEEAVENDFEEDFCPGGKKERF